MQTHEPVGIFSSRLILAAAVFALAVLGGIALLVVLPHETKGKKLAHPAPPKVVASAADDEGTFFYDAVGRAPRGFTDDVPTTGQEPGAKVSYTLEIKVAGSRGEAEKTIDQLHDQGIEAYYTPLTREGHVVFRVRRGIFSSQRDADKAVVAMRQGQAIEAHVVKLQ